MHYTGQAALILGGIIFGLQNPRMGCTGEIISALSKPAWVFGIVPG
jgi:hypothetical protein